MGVWQVTIHRGNIVHQILCEMRHRRQGRRKVLNNGRYLNNEKKSLFANVVTVSRAPHSFE